MKHRWEIVAVGIAAGIPASLVGLYVRQTAIGSGYDFLPLYAAVAAISSGIFFEHFQLRKRKTYTFKRGAVAGGLTGFVSHYLCWYLIILVHNICYAGWRGCTDSLGSPPIDPLQGLAGAAVLSAASLLLLGWATIPLGVIIGGLLAVWLRRRLELR